MKRRFLVLVAILALALWVVPVSATITTADLYFTVGNISGTGGAGQYTLGPGQYFADLHITVDTDGGSTGIASFDLTPGQGSLAGNPVNFVLLGTGSAKHVLGLSVIPTSGAGPFDLTLSPLHPARTPFNPSDTTLQLTRYQGNPGESFDGFGAFNTGINSNQNGFTGAMTEITFTSTQQFANADAVLAALRANSDGWLAAADIGAYYTTGVNAGKNTGITGSTHNGIPTVPIPPSALLLGSGLLGMGVLGSARALANLTM